MAVHMIDPAVTGRVIQRLRRRKGLSQEVVSGLAGISRQYYSNIECGKVRMSMDVFTAIADAMLISGGGLLLDVISEGGLTNGWRSFSERAPDKSGDIWVADPETGRISSAYYSRKGPGSGDVIGIPVDLSYGTLWLWKPKGDA